MKASAMKNVLHICIILLLFSFSVTGQVPTQDIVSHISNGDAAALSDHFNQTLDIGLPDKDQDYSKTQGQRVVKEFFEKFPPSKFTLEQEGEMKAGNHFLIGDYHSGDKQFQVYVLFTEKESKWFITKFKIEEE